MLALGLVFLAVLASSAAQAGIPRYMQGQWMISDGNLQDEDTDGQFLSVKERVWPQSPEDVVEVVTVKELTLQTTSESQAMGQQEDSSEGEHSATWKAFLVVVILLVSVVGSLSAAYYMCVWRGGRIFYKPHKEDYA